MAADGFSLEPLLTPNGADLSENVGSRIVGVSGFLIAITTIFVLLRFVARLLSQAGLWWDDWCILAAMLVSWGSPICMIISIQYGFGRHIAALGDFTNRLDATYHWFKIFYAYETMYTTAVTLTKYSILLFYSRIFQGGKFRIVLIGMAALCTAWFIAIEISVIIECHPINALWDFSPGYCIDLQKMFLGSGIINIFLNVLVLMLPMPMIWSLEIERKHKIMLSGVFLLGGFIVVVSIVRVVYITRLQQSDLTWQWVNGALWTSVEPAIGVVSACLPILRSLWIWSRPKSSRRSNKLSQKSVVSQKSSKPHDPNRGSFTSRYPLNELSNDAEVTWGNGHAYDATGANFSKMAGTSDIPLINMPSPQQLEAGMALSHNRITSLTLGKKAAELYG